MSQCIQCGKETTENFCSNCGQKQDIPRLTLKTFLYDFASRIYGLDGAMPRTIIGLSSNPGKVIKEYVSGVRNKYVGPVGYYFLLFAVYLLLFRLFDTDFFEYNSDWVNSTVEGTTGQKLEVEDIARQKQLQEKIFSVIQILPILVFPFIAWTARLFFRSSGYNFMENMVFLFYVNAHMIFINMSGLIFSTISGYSDKLIISVLGVTYFAICGSLFFTQKLSFWGFLKSVLVYIFGFVAMVLLASIITIVVALIKEIVLT